VWLFGRRRRSNNSLVRSTLLIAIMNLSPGAGASCKQVTWEHRPLPSFFLSLLLPFPRPPCLSSLFPWSVWYQCHRDFPSRNCKIPAQYQNFRKFPFLKHSETSHKRTLKSVNKLTQSRGVAHVGARTLFFSSFPSLLSPFPSPPLSCFPFQVAHCNYKLVRRG